MRLMFRALFLLLSVGVAVIASWWVLQTLKGGDEEASTPASGTRAANRGIDVGRFLPPLPLGVTPPGEGETAETLAEPPSLIFVDTRDAKHRATVRIGGREVGQSPYMGQVRCQPGDVVVVELEYADGSVVNKRAPCSEEIRVTH